MGGPQQGEMSSAQLKVDLHLNPDSFCIQKEASERGVGALFLPWAANINYSFPQPTA